MREVKDPYELIKQLYAVLGRIPPSEDTFALSGITITVDGPTIEVAERGMVIDRKEYRVEISIDEGADSATIAEAIRSSSSNVSLAAEQVHRSAKART